MNAVKQPATTPNVGAKSERIPRACLTKRGDLRIPLRVEATVKVPSAMMMLTRAFVVVVVVMGVVVKWLDGGTVGWLDG